jgi:hypothetical protein
MACFKTTYRNSGDSVIDAGRNSRGSKLTQEWLI